MFDPFQDRNQHLFGTVSLRLFVMKSISKTYSFNWFWTKPRGKICILAKVIFNFCAKIVFFTNMESNASVTLHFEDLAVQNY